MQTAPATGRLANPALRQGLIFGVILGVLEIAYSYIPGIANLGLTSTFIVFGLYLVIPLIAALRASAQTGRVKTGWLTGLFTAFLGSFINAVYIFITILINIDALTKNAITAAKNAHQDASVITSSVVLTFVAVNLLFIVILAALVGLAGGALGGVIGKNRAQIPTQEYQESMFEAPAPTSERSKSSEVPPAP